LICDLNYVPVQWHTRITHVILKCIFAGAVKESHDTHSYRAFPTGCKRNRNADPRYAQRVREEFIQAA
jgi:hypothetical protein